MARKRPKIEWNVPRGQRTANRRPGASREAKKRIQWDAAPEGRSDNKPRRGRGTAEWESEAARLTAGNEEQPRYKEVTGLTPEIADRLVPGTMMVLEEHVERSSHYGKNWPVPLLIQHMERPWDEKYDLKSSCLLPRGGMVIYVGRETVDAARGKHRNVRMEVHKFLVRDGIYALMDFSLVRFP